MSRKHVDLAGEDTELVRMNADQWLELYIKTDIPEKDRATPRCRYLDDVEALCIIIADDWKTSPTQVYAAGASYYSEDHQIDGLKDMKTLRSKVIKCGNQSALAYVAADMHRKHFFEGRTKQIRMERGFVETTSGIASGYGTEACDIYLLNWWCWFSGFVDTYTALNVLKDTPAAKRGFRILEETQDRISDENKIWRKFLE